ncbi:MAG: hypothetical protein UY48_C0008G0029 [Candidatus Gottesmanbacteria bacterium GW2011_GWB1_49_7]|uniref:Uncharacterized protein n=1 Tax=Candidatus Gottesmanbacteria bacterium GW2011_GWB1_49_7 TaxID=1618448 RepID=A0A0G1Z278_9BACT|nr:MAG: hypothetical protein UY48_C0008G0029 [Candidatus Gottesmanbacteria bacterium GW2011_GWB1_49_7]
MEFVTYKRRCRQCREKWQVTLPEDAIRGAINGKIHCPWCGTGHTINPLPASPIVAVNLMSTRYMTEEVITSTLKKLNAGLIPIRASDVKLGLTPAKRK